MRVWLGGGEGGGVGGGGGACGGSGEAEFQRLGSADRNPLVMQAI